MKKLKSLVISLIFLVLSGSSVFSQTDLLPDITILPEYLYEWEYDDTSIVPGRMYIRLSVATPNIGLGRLHLRGEEGTLPVDVYQRIFRTNGTFWDRLAGTFAFHSNHEHIHFEGWASYNLREVLPNDEVGQIKASGGKVSFCIVDYELYDSSLPNYEGSLFGGCFSLLQGLSVGYMDIYSKFLPDQWIDIQNLPAGTYFLEALVDPDNNILESDTTNNTARIKIDLCHNELFTYPGDDSLFILDANVKPFSDGKIDISIKNSLQLREITIPITWSGNFDILFDSVSTVGHRTEYFDDPKIVAKDLRINKLAIWMKSSSDLSVPDLPPGEGTVLSFYYRIPDAQEGDSVVFEIAPFNNKFMDFGLACFAYEPNISTGVMRISCCTGERGNIDNDFTGETNIADLTFMVNYLFKNGLSPECEMAADLNASGEINILDLTHIVSYLFKNGPAPASCTAR